MLGVVICVVCCAFFINLGPVCFSSGSTSAFKAYCANAVLYLLKSTEETYREALKLKSVKICVNIIIKSSFLPSPQMFIKESHISLSCMISGLKIFLSKPMGYCTKNEKCFEM
jgi:hypothetical protein